MQKHRRGWMTSFWMFFSLKPCAISQLFRFLLVSIWLPDLSLPGFILHFYQVNLSVPLCKGPFSVITTILITGRAVAWSHLQRRFCQTLPALDSPAKWEALRPPNWSPSSCSEGPSINKRNKKLNGIKFESWSKSGFRSFCPFGWIQNYQKCRETMSKMPFVGHSASCPL